MVNKGPEKLQASQGREVTNLSETAQAVVKTLTERVTETMRTEGFVENINRIHRGEVIKGSAEHQDIVTKLKDLQDRLIEKAKKENADSESINIIENYFSKLVASIE